MKARFTFDIEKFLENLGTTEDGQPILKDWMGGFTTHENGDLIWGGCKITFPSKGIGLAVHDGSYEKLTGLWIGAAWAARITVKKFESCRWTEGGADKWAQAGQLTSCPPRLRKLLRQCSISSGFFNAQDLPEWAREWLVANC
jgi:hypothetical protein